MAFDNPDEQVSNKHLFVYLDLHLPNAALPVDPSV